MICPVKKRRATMELGDDGTMDTVFQCSACAREVRYTFAADDLAEADYDGFVEWARGEAPQDHVTMFAEAISI